MSPLARIPVLWLSAALAVVCAAQAPVARVYVEGGEVVSQGLKPIDTSSWDDTFQVTEVEGTECFATEAGNEWLRLVLDPAWPQDATGPATIGIRFFDGRPGETSGPVVMQYDSADPERMMDGAWAWTPPVWRGGTGAWVTAYWTIEQPAFRHRELGADFGISGKTNRRLPALYIAEVTVTRAGILLAADVQGLALGDRSAAAITVRVFGPDGNAVPDDTPVTFAASLGTCEPAQAAVTAGSASTTFTPAGEMGEAIIQASCDFSAHEMRLPLVHGSGGVTEVDWIVTDFEDERASLETIAYLSNAVTGTVAVLPEAAHGGDSGAGLDYEGDPDATWFNAGVERLVPVPGVLRGLSVWAKATEPNAELRWAVFDAKDEHWNYPAPVLATGEDGWRRYGSTTVDAYYPNGDALLDHPLTFHSVYVARSPWSKIQKGTLHIDDIVAQLLVANSEVEELQVVGP